MQSGSLLLNRETDDGVQTGCCPRILRDSKINLDNQRALFIHKKSSSIHLIQTHVSTQIDNEFEVSKNRWKLSTTHTTPQTHKYRSRTRAHSELYSQMSTHAHVCPYILPTRKSILEEKHTYSPLLEQHQHLHTETDCNSCSFIHHTITVICASAVLFVYGAVILFCTLLGLLTGSISLSPHERKIDKYHYLRFKNRARASIYN